MNNKPFNLDSLAVCKDLQLESLLKYKDSTVNDADRMHIEQHIRNCDSCSKTLMDIKHFYGDHTTDLLEEEWEQNRSKMNRKLAFINYKIGLKENFLKVGQSTLIKVQQILAAPQFVAFATCLIIMVYAFPLLTNNNKQVLATNENLYFPPYVDIDNEAIYPDQLAYYDLQSKYENMSFGSLRYARTQY